MKKFLKPTLLSAALAMTLAFGAAPLTSHAAEAAPAVQAVEAVPAVQAVENAPTVQPVEAVPAAAAVPAADASATAVPSATVSLQGKKVSILGDSISTFDGYIPTDYNIFYPGSGNISTVEKTWWWQVMNATGMELNANASYSNTTITGDSLDTTGSAPGCSTKRMIDLTPGDDGPAPDILIVFMGTNDFLRSVELGTFTEPSPQDEGVVNNFCDAYELMIQKLNALYPNAEIYFCTLLETNAGDVDEYPQSYPATNKNGNTIGDFNAEIATIASAYSYPVIDVHNCGITYETLDQYTSDGVHPNTEGAKLIAEYVTNALLY